MPASSRLLGYGEAGMPSSSRLPGYGEAGGPQTAGQESQPRPFGQIPLILPMQVCPGHFASEPAGLVAWILDPGVESAFAANVSNRDAILFPLCTE
ncbi:unnamed protein product [Cuscuta europaea]|uniref:Uncharacterized protein n=1 Tax=Cuscuta europaea TaxID=41803 RepID=A0A9P0VQV1_CUSEU|nr:unnamed protein product [Cuscuta europaea]